MHDVLVERATTSANCRRVRSPSRAQIRAFEAELAPEEHNQPRACLAEFLPYGATAADGEPPEFVLVWKEDEKLPRDEPPSPSPSLVMTPRIIEAAASVALPFARSLTRASEC